MDSKPEETHESTDSMENRLQQLREHIRRMEEENEELFRQIGISPHEAQNLLNDPTRLDKEAFEFIQRERQALEAILERRLDEVRAAVKKEHSPEDPPVGGHWILMR